MFFACLIHVWIRIACRFRVFLRILLKAAFLIIIWAVTFVSIVMILFIVRLWAGNPWLGFLNADALILARFIVVLGILVWFRVVYLSLHILACGLGKNWLHEFRFLSMSSVFLACKHVTEELTLLLHVEIGVLGKWENVERQHRLRIKLVTVVLLDLQQLELIWLLSRVWNWLDTVFHLLHYVFVLQTHDIILLSLDICVE
jgi:hypothetical protein